MSVGLVVCLALVACDDDNETNPEVRVTFIHLNDVYEIQPVSGGTLGGLARVKTLKQQLLSENRNTFLTLAGDIHGPSGLGTAVVDGEQLAGREMVAVLNNVGVDYFTFGDHEFNIWDGELHLKRIDEATFPTINSNVFMADGALFPNQSISTIITVRNPSGNSIRVGIFGLTEEIGRPSVELTYVDAIEAAKVQVAALRPQVDILVALTHFRASIDLDIAQQFPQIDLILGGDDHQNMALMPENGPPIFKSDSNARNVQVIDVVYNTDTDALGIESRLVRLDDTIAEEPDIAAQVQEWLDIGFDGFRNDGIEPTEIIAVPTVDLNGFADAIRSGPTELTRLLVNGVNNVAIETLGHTVDLSLIPSAPIRLDDLIPAGSNFTQFDVLRTFPTPGVLAIVVDVLGSDLQALLELGSQAVGSGLFVLLTENVAQNAAGEFLIDGAPIDPGRTYRAGTLDFSLRLYEGLQVVEESDMDSRALLIQELQDTFPAPASAGN